MQISIRWKLFIFVAGFNILVAILLSYSVYNVSYQLFFDNFLKNKLLFTKSISAGIRGSIHQQIDSIEDMQSSNYRYLHDYLHTLRLSDTTISYLYTLQYDSVSDKIRYCVDADVAGQTMVWFEAQNFAFKYVCDSVLGDYVSYDNKAYNSSFEINDSSRTYNINLVSSRNFCRILLNNKEILLFDKSRSFAFVKNDTLSDKRLATSLFVFPNKPEQCVLNISLSLKNQPISFPGEEYTDELQNINLYKRILKNGRDTIDATFKDSNYGRCISAYGIIKDDKNRPSGLVVMDFYEHELDLLRTSVTRVSLLISVLAIILVLIVLPFLLEIFVIKHIKKLNLGFQQMGGKNFDTSISIRTKDEFETLADGFNAMATNLKTFYDDLDYKVSERTSVIEQQKEELQVQTDNLLEINGLLHDKNKILQVQKEQIEAQNSQIVSSINYAKRIQSALLQSTETIDTIIEENFVFYKPRDIVSGDFYYIREIGDWIIIIAADCTGHGVPGAFMSVLGIGILNELLQADTEVQTDRILNQLRSKIIASFEQSHKTYEPRDGMDIAFVALNKQKGIAQFSGAYNPLWIIRRNNFELVEIKACTMPIGAHPKDSVSFAFKEIQFERGDAFYVFSDGYLSQFGGELGTEKFKTRRFRDLIQSVSHLSMKEQKKILTQKFAEWKGSVEQTDDVLVIGVRI